MKARDYAILGVGILGLSITAFLIDRGHDGIIRDTFVGIIGFFLGWNVPTPWGKN